MLILRTLTVASLMSALLGFAAPTAGSAISTGDVIPDNPRVSLAAGDPSAGDFRRDNDVALNYPSQGVFLDNSQSGQRSRIDTDSAGAPLVPSWVGRTCAGPCPYNANPGLVLNVDSVTRNGDTVAFCSNYRNASQPLLYVKNLVSGRLTQTTVRCGIGRYRESTIRDSDEFMFAPAISDDGRVIHLSGDRVVDDYLRQVSWRRDRIYFPKSGKVRLVSGHGEMTRDGGTIFLRMASQGLIDRYSAPSKVGAYSVATGKTKVLPWWDKFFDGFNNPTDVFGVSRDRMTRRGRYLVNDSEVIDRSRGVIVSISSTLADRGYNDGTVVSISNDGKTINVSLPDSASGDFLAVTDWGWQPMARATLEVDEDAPGKLFVDVDPDRGRGFWTFVVQQLLDAEEGWETLPGVYETQGAKETSIVDLTDGTYRIKVEAKYGYRGVTTKSCYVED